MIFERHIMVLEAEINRIKNYHNEVVKRQTKEIIALKEENEKLKSALTQIHDYIVSVNNQPSGTYSMPRILTIISEVELV